MGPALPLHAAVSLIQYMLAKLIKHGIKVFVACCSYSSFLFSSNIYCAKEFDDRTVLQLVDDLIQSANLLVMRGHKLFTDNHNTSVKLAKHMFEKYCSMSMTDKNHAQAMMYHFKSFSMDPVIQHYVVGTERLFLN